MFIIGTCMTRSRPARCAARPPCGIMVNQASCVYRLGYPVQSLKFAALFL